MSYLASEDIIYMFMEPATGLSVSLRDVTSASSYILFLEG